MLYDFSPLASESRFSANIHRGQVVVVLAVGVRARGGVFAYAQAAAERIGGRCAGERGGEVLRAS